MDSHSSTALAAQAHSDNGKRSIVRAMAERLGMETAAFERTLIDTVMPKSASREAVAAFLVVASEHNLNPFTREIFAFEGQGGGVRPIVSIDGWIRIVNEHPQFDGVELLEVFGESGHLEAVEAKFYRKDRAHPIVIREYLAECKRNTEPWNRWPRRMLRHKAYIQGARLAFGFAGIEDEDEVERYMEATRRAAVPTATIDLSKARVGVAVDPPGGSPIGRHEPEAEPDASQDAPPIHSHWHRDIEILLEGPADAWLDTQIKGPGPLNGLTFRHVAASSDPKLVAERERVLADGAMHQAQNGRTPKFYQQIAQACLLAAEPQVEGYAEAQG